jgi:hypothetical protein
MNEKNEYDVCIAGSGPAGAFAANLLAKNGYNVIIIEAGGDFLNSNIDEIIDLENSNLTNSINFGLSRQIGGSSNLWGGALVKMDDIDLEIRPEYNFLNWPVKKNELSMLYQRVAKIIGIESSLDKEFLSNKNYIKDLLHSTNIKFKEMHFMQHPFNTRVLINNVKNITVKKNHEVCALKICKENKSISSMQAFNSINSSFVDIKAKKFILATGIIDNIRILLHSLKSLSSNNNNLLDIIGKGFSTHPKGVVGKIKFNKGIINKSPFLMVKSAPSVFIRYFFGFNDKYIKKITF